MLMLHPQSLSPDPCYAQSLMIDTDGWARVDLHPVELCFHSGLKAAPPELDRFRAASPIVVTGDQDARGELLLDFGTEIEAELEIVIEAPQAMNVYATFGESRPEAEGLGGYGQGRWCQVQHWHVPERGVCDHRFPAVGFRFVRLQLHDIRHPVTLREVVAHAQFVGEQQVGDFECEDKLLQRLWQTSVYTARACTRPDDIWDGIKRDRLGWYGDARIAAMTYATTFLDPAPASGMLAKLPTDEWVNGIPNFSFDAVAMLRDLLLAHGRDIPLRDENLQRIRAMLEWAEATQTNGDGFIIKTDAELQFGYGFLDWSSLPVGGRLEQLSWLQAKYLEALRNAAQISSWLGDSESAERYRLRADKLSGRIVEKFWSDECGFHHTLRRVREGYEKYSPGWGEASYNTDSDLGPSGASRHATAAAAFAGLATTDRWSLMLEELDKLDQPPVVTPMFLYYEQEARARLGDPIGAIERMRSYLADMVETNDAATIWESFEPQVRDFRKWGLHAWPKSLCHGWGSGLVPLLQRWLLGLENLAPGWSRVRLHKPAMEMGFSATVPTPFGPIRVDREPGRAPKYQLPSGIDVEPQAE
jgi:alpha-L-rhamnosidase